jgi:Fe-S-cluster containining protein
MHEDAEQSERAEAWIRLAGQACVRERLEAVYVMAREAIEARGPACWASGRCCNFEKTGHRLYCTGLEAAYTVVGLRAMGRSEPSEAEIELARRDGGCPLQVANLCGAHEIKPMGCRVYFCDRRAQDWQHELSERLMNEIRRVHEEFEIEYVYGEWRSLLSMFSGR